MTEVLVGALRDRRRPLSDLRAEISDALELLRRRRMARRSRELFSAAPPPLEPRALTTASSFGRTYRHLTFASEYEPRRGRARRRALARPHRQPHRSRLDPAASRSAAPVAGVSPRLPHGLAAHRLLPVQPALAPRDARREPRAAGPAVARTALERLAERGRALHRRDPRHGAPAGASDLGSASAARVAARPRRHADRTLRPLARRRHRRPHGRPRARPRLRHRRHADGRRDGPRATATCRHSFAAWPRASASRSTDDRARCCASSRRSRSRRACRPTGSSSSAAPPIAWCRRARCSALWHHWGQPRIEWHGGSHTSFGIESEVNTLVSEALALTRLAARAA